MSKVEAVIPFQIDVGTNHSSSTSTTTLRRTLDWTDAFWFAAGVPALVLFTVGAVASAVGNISSLVWVISIFLGFLQCFTYAEISGLYPNKSGGASVYGAMAWVRYGKMLGPISVWANWFSWSPVLAIGSGLAGGYILNMLFTPDSAIRMWEITLFDMGFIKDGLKLRLNATFFVGLALVLGIFSLQHRGIAKAAKIQMIVALAALLPLFLIGIAPFFSGDFHLNNFTPLVPLAHDATGAAVNGTWNNVGWTIFMGGLFLAAWSSYPFETAVCYVSEFKDPSRDTIRAMIYSGLLCVLFFTLVPVAFQGFLGIEGLMSPGIIDGSGVGEVMAKMVGGGAVVQNIIVCMLILAVALVIMTAMAGSSRTLLQGSVDGWLPKYLSNVNHNGAPVAAMWTDLCFNIFLLMLSDYLYLLVLANATYMIFVFLNLQSGWLHRIDNAHLKRPYRCPTWLLATGAILGFFNLLLLGWGADLWGKNALLVSLIITAGIIPVFAYRHYVTDKGQFPKTMCDAMEVPYGGAFNPTRKAGVLPYITLIAGAVAIYIGTQLAVYA